MTTDVSDAVLDFKRDLRKGDAFLNGYCAELVNGLGVMVAFAAWPCQ
jgi:hypothetical protein